ncbi:MAG: hypothetical protein C0596_03765 [Marinilabiliales bacterium]|nr:MAG: hypothetical protein C0596_03765 [Marinilabiliales bacterium]
MRLKTKNKKLKTFTDYLLAITLVAVVDTISWFIFRQGNYHVVSLVLLFLVSILATFLNTWVVLSAATLSALSWNYFFIPPHFTFHI